MPFGGRNRAPYAIVKLGRAGKPGRVRGCPGQAKRRHARRVGTHAGAFSLGMAPSSLCVCVTKMSTMCHSADAKDAAGDRP